MKKKKSAKASKPVVKLPIDGNIFGILGACTRALKRAGKSADAEKLSDRVFKSDSYDEALSICQEYVTFEEEEE